MISNNDIFLDQRKIAYLNSEGVDVLDRPDLISLEAIILCCNRSRRGRTGVDELTG